MRPEIDRGLALVGGLGLALAALVGGVILLRGNTLIPPEGDLTKSLTFNGALGLYYLTLAFLLPVAGFSQIDRRRWLRAIVVIAVYSYAVETVQIFRGIDPRFSDAGSSWDDLAGIVFALSAGGQILAFAVFAHRFFLLPTSLVVLAVRYASSATMLAFVAGVWMSVIGDRYTGDSGNLLPLHALGLHALQAIPLLGWLLQGGAIPAATSRLVLHLAGSAWIAACLAVAWQTAAGRSLTDPSPVLLGALLLLLLWAGTFLSAIHAWQRTLRRRETVS